MLEVSEGGRAVLTGVAVGVALPLDLRRSFSAFSVSISFCLLVKERRDLTNSYISSVLPCAATGIKACEQHLMFKAKAQIRN